MNKKYNIIYSDPPWEQKKSNKRKVRPKQKKSLDYETLCMADIQEIHRKFSNKTELKHNFFMWTIDKFLHESEQMMEELGYTLHARLVWDKQNGIAPAFTVRFSHEYLLWFYKKGNILMPCEKMKGKQTTILREKSTSHSKKPLVAYEMIESMFPEGNKIELFARNYRHNWDVWGNEVE
jgi:N6-adenosine-specific RNA methylase IME4|tara:strand:- start:160 stop:696 length:537 start_codon:yes stop_codon:yes gene_type:complete